MIPKMLDMLTTWPSCDASRCGRKLRVPFTTPQKFTSMTRRKSASSKPCTVAPYEMPALLNTS